MSKQDVVAKTDYKLDRWRDRWPFLGLFGKAWGKTADKDDDRPNRFEALTGQQVQPESLRAPGGAKD